MVDSYGSQKDKFAKGSATKTIVGLKNTYTLGRVLGEGGQAIVFLAKSKDDQGKHRYWAIKVFNKQSMDFNIKKFQNMIKEIQCLRQVGQSESQMEGLRNIIHLEETIKSENFYYLVFEFCNGGDVRDMLIKCHPIGVYKVQHIIRQIALGIQAMHVNFKIIHRDIKPENVLLSAPGLKPSVNMEQVWSQADFANSVDVKLCDFGISKELDAKGTETVVGTANFTCPEILLGYTYDFKADVWSLGSLTFELLVGSPIMNFYDPSRTRFDDKFMDGIIYVPRLDRISLECVDFLAQSLQFMPSERPEMKALLTHPFLVIPTQDQTPVPLALFSEFPASFLGSYALQSQLAKLQLLKIDTRKKINYLNQESWAQAKIVEKRESVKKQVLKVPLDTLVVKRQQQIIDQSIQDTIYLD